MAIDDKYGVVEVKGIPDKEPIFILRAQDRFSLPLILIYKSWIAALSRIDDKMLVELRRVIFAFGKWEFTKTPDSE